MRDREVQDLVIRALADSPFRHSPDWTDLDLADAIPVDKFSKFLARHFYYERLVHFFKYSRALATLTKRSPLSILKTAEFDALLPTIVLGSRDSAERVADLARSHLRDGSAAGVSFLEDLLSYQREMMVLEAGPRFPTTNPEESTLGSYSPGEYVQLDFEFDIPSLLPQILRASESTIDVPRKPTRLLIARSSGGRVTVLRHTPLIERILSKLDGSRDLSQLSAELGSSSNEIEDLIRGLAEVGAVRFGRGS